MDPDLVLKESLNQCELLDYLNITLNVTNTPSNKKFCNLRFQFLIALFKHDHKCLYCRYTVGVIRMNEHGAPFKKY